MSLFLSPHQTGPFEVNWDDPLNKGLVAWWPFRQAGDMLLRDVVDGNHGSLHSSMTSDDWIAGPVPSSKALDFDGSNDVVTISHVYDITKPFTVCSWLNLTWSAITYPWTFEEFSLRYQSDTRIQIHRHGVSFYCSTIWDPGWNFITVAWDGATVYLYANRNSSSASVASWDASTGIRLGTSPAGGFFPGEVSDFRVYDRYLGPSEVMSLYQASLRGYPTQFKRTQIPLSIQAVAATGQYSSIFESTIFGGSVIA